MIKLIWDKREWCCKISEAPTSDFYHTYDYHHLSSLEEERPVLIVYEEGPRRILLPLLVRDIPDSPYRDVTSVYGYAGPLGVGLEEDYDNSQFRTELQNLFEENKIVSVFSRLDPFIPNQGRILEGLGELSSPGKVVFIDLKKDLSVQWAEYNRRLRGYINKSRREYDIIDAKSDSEYEEFIQMYLENMHRVKAESRYFFRKEYFFDLLKSKDIGGQLLMARRKSDNRLVGGAIFIRKKQIVQYHLSGAIEEVLKLNPIKLLIDEMRIRAKSEGLTYFNLGGGVGNNEDSLYRFKTSFSKETRDFRLWKYIVNQTVYDQLVLSRKQGICQNFVKNCNDFFPCYRCAK